MCTVKVIIRTVTQKVKLGVVCVKVKLGGVGSDNVSNGGGVDTKEYGPQDRLFGIHHRIGVGGWMGCRLYLCTGCYSSGMI